MKDRIQPNGVSRSLRARAVRREKEIATAWSVLERHGFPMGMLPFEPGGRRGRLPQAINGAFKLVNRRLARERKNSDILRSKIAWMVAKEVRYDNFGELRMVVRARGIVVIRRPGAMPAVVNEARWEAMAREPVRLKERAR